MKKKYINPSMEIVKIELQQVIAMSTLGTTDKTEGNLSRSFDLEEDEEEY